MLSAARLREILEYDPATGIFRWRRQKGRSRPSLVAGYKHARGYLRITIDGHAYLLHRLAWFYVHGVWPRDQIDHINRVRNDNRITNLREATGQLNAQNSVKPPSKNGYPRGVHKHATKYRAAINIDGFTLRLGSFDSAEKAHRIYLYAKRAFHGGRGIFA